MVHYEELGKPAQTLYKALDYDASQDMSRVLLTPITGRSIVTCAFNEYGHPIRAINCIILIQVESTQWHTALHASYLAFKQPLSGEHLEIQSCVVPF